MARLGIIGGGMMGEAIIARLLFQGLWHPADISVSDPAKNRRSFLHQQYGVAVTDLNEDVAQCEVVVLAVKPQSLVAAVAGLATAPCQLWCSILAGVPLSQLEALLGNKAVIRAMPNTPARVGAAVTALAAGKWVAPEQMDLARKLFGSIGTVVEVPEHLLDGVTALSGSGPAYVALMVEALADGGVTVGLPRAIAQELAIHTVLGTARLLAETGMHPGQLKDQVTSPAGTTIAGLRCLERGAVRSALIEAVVAAESRAKELGKG
ncbi:MAG: pyrroline-5-carboxylate reductase [Oscillatoriales cyanobacterium SM2_2_1]|nr:pyrroline-5-carboxylate reductase [Oscillatoriales cyanobacterium SM2_2_1]